MKQTFILFLLLLSGNLFAQNSMAPVSHELRVRVQPQAGTLEVTDNVLLPSPVNRLSLILHKNLKPVFTSSLGKVKVTRGSQKRDWQSYILQLPDNSVRFSVSYSGRIHHPLGSEKAVRSRGFRDSAGIIDEQGVFLAGSSHWYPQLEGFPYLTFSLTVDLPAGWSSVSQGERSNRSHHSSGSRDYWVISKPQEQIYLIAARFQEYSRPIPGAGEPLVAQVFLREADEQLAGRYLDATVQYLQLYEEMIGPYSFSKFALVENFWETGFGMPSFTLMGSRVIRLPFILYSSYPHEVLHNWWGNGVYVDYRTGNWSEGLTAYQADHYLKEQRGQGADYRQQNLQKYRDYAASKRDSAIRDFTSRHSSASEAVGYGKTMMLFHMLRKKLGDQQFNAGLRKLYRDYQFKEASFNDIRQLYEQLSGESLNVFFEQWVSRVGAPELSLSEVRVKEKDARFQIDFTLQQLQQGSSYELDIPVKVTLSGQEVPEEAVLPMTSKRQHFSMMLNSRPERLDIDPEFDLFRKLSAAETPPALTQIFGATELLVVTPGAGQKDMKAAWEAFASSVSYMGPEKVNVMRDDEIEQLPKDSAVLVLGWGNRFAEQVKERLGQHPVEFEGHRIRLANTDSDRQGYAFAMVTREDLASETSLPQAFIVADLPAALPGLARKIPHYHKYSYLAFSGEAPENQVKGRWPVNKSPMSVVID